MYQTPEFKFYFNLYVRVKKKVNEKIERKK